MKHSLRILSLILALLTFALMAFGSSSETTEITDANTVDGSSDKTDKDGGTATEEGAAALATIEQTVLIKDEFLTITATEYVNDLIWGEERVPCICCSSNQGSHRKQRHQRPLRHA